MKIDSKFNEREKELLKELNVDVYKEYDEDRLEELEEIVYNKMMDSLDNKQEFTPIAEEYEDILNIIVDIENSLKRHCERCLFIFQRLAIAGLFLMSFYFVVDIKEQQR